MKRYAVVAFNPEDAEKAREWFPRHFCQAEPRESWSLLTSAWSADLYPHEAAELRRLGLRCRPEL